MSDVTFTIHTKYNGQLTATSLTSDWPTVTRSETQTLRFWFNNPDVRDSLVIEDGESHTIPSGESETYRRLVIEDGGSLTVDGDLTIEAGGLWTLLQYLDYAGAVATGEDGAHVPWYRSQLDSRADVGSLVLGIEPSSDIEDRSVTGLWGVVTGGRDVRNSTLTNWQLELEVFVLAEYREHSDRAAMESAHKE